MVGAHIDRAEVALSEISEADAKAAARYAVAAIRRLGQLGGEAADAFVDELAINAGDPEFEAGYEVINT